jgi:stage V sporulation protein D (sporulation-specific penicillin-binding protein)
MAVRSVVRSDFTRRRIQIAFWVILACYLGLVGRLVYLQVAQGAAIRAQAQQIREQKIPLRGHRGSICDREGRPLAVSLYSGIAGFDPTVTLVDPKDAKKAARTAKELADSIHRAAPILKIPEPDLQRVVHMACTRLAKTPKLRFVPIKRDIPLEVAQHIRDTRPHLLGFGIQDGEKRVYSSGVNAAQVVGFVGSEGGGKAGLERACRRWLDARQGYAYAEVDDHHREIPDTLLRMIPARDGLDIHTTLDANVQHIVTDEAQRIYEKFHPNGVSVVAVNPNNGDVLALVSLPNYDPNPDQRKTLTGEALAERCTARLYEPGSTLKALTIAAALEEGTITLNNSFYCAGQLKVGNRTIHCASHGGKSAHGQETPLDIIRNSCNIGAAQIGMKMGPKHLFAADRKFGLLDPLDIGLPAEQHGRLSFAKHEQIYTQAKAARVAFGHAITTTPLHVAMAYAAFANGGLLMKPRLITSVTDATGKARQQWEPKVVRRVVSQQTSAQICMMLRAVVAAGTAKVAAIPGYQIAGKTGTAEKYKRGAYVGSFIGFLPASPNVRPRVVILIAVDEPQGAHYGADVAAPGFQAMAQRLMAYWHVPEDDPGAVQYQTAQAHLHHSGHASAATIKVAGRD